MVFLPAATKLGQSNIFTGVCLSTGGGEGCLPQCMLGYTPWSRSPGADILPEQTPPRADTPQSRHPQTPPGADTPWSRYPPEQTPPRADPPGADPPPEQTPQSRHPPGSIRSTSGRYASYWNAFLFSSGASIV